MWDGKIILWGKEYKLKKKKKEMEAIMKMFGGGGCVKQTTLAKYSKRPSPPYPANECCDMTLKGNDGLMYKSEANKNGVCTWKPLERKEKSKKSKKSKKSRKGRKTRKTRKGGKRRKSCRR